MSALVIRAVLKRSFYRDSVALMRVAEALRARPGVREAAALMGTPANLELLGGAGLVTGDTAGASPSDLILAVAADDAETAEAALGTALILLAERPRMPHPAGETPPRTLERALWRAPSTNLVSISVPGAYATLQARRALQRGLHVFLFSDNVPLADEVALKQLATSRRLLCMGPDCGTAYVAGIGLGFANVVASGRVGCVAASGTGLQAVAARLDALGEGISHGIGVGGRDLSLSVRGAMTLLALDVLAGDDGTEIIVVISKPPAPEVLPALETALAQTGKPVVVCCLGAHPPTSGRIIRVATLEDAADAAVATLRGRGWRERPLGDRAGLRARLRRVAPSGQPCGHALLGLYTGGTLAQEARVVLEPLVGQVSATLCGAGATGHRIVDLGDDEFTMSRPHPMLDPEFRAVCVREAGLSSAVGVVLVDLVLGRGAHENPARTLADAVHDARQAAGRDGRVLFVVGSVVGTRGDPQGLVSQAAMLKAAGVELFASNAQAARFAGLLLEERRRAWRTS
ncbi:MAG: acyl-CoA synthetase FdrA [Candidatus Rokuibacteriota bacterium]